MTAMDPVGASVRVMDAQTSASGTTRGAVAVADSTGFSAMFVASAGQAGSGPETTDAVNPDAGPATPAPAAASLDQPISAEQSTDAQAMGKMPGNKPAANAVHARAEIVNSKGARDPASSDESHIREANEIAAPDRTLNHATYPAESDQGSVDAGAQGPADVAAALPTMGVAADEASAPHVLRGKADMTSHALASSGAVNTERGTLSVVDLVQKPVDRPDDQTSPVVVGTRAPIREGTALTIDLPSAFAALRTPAIQPSALEQPAVQVLPGRQSADRFQGPLLMLARDVVLLSGDADVRFNIRPETLGPVAVTIARGEDGTRLHLGVESQTALQAVRQAEPRLTESAARSGAPFVDVTVDLNAREQRGRPPTVVPPHRTDRNAVAETKPIDGRVARTGRFA